MHSEPVIQHRKEQPYAAIETTVNMKDISTALPPLIPEVFSWLAKNKIDHAGPPFFEYLRMDNDNQLLVHVGVPVNQKVKGDGHVIGGSFPDGEYAVMRYTGDYIHLKDEHMFLESWAEKKGFKGETHVSANGTEWGSRTEVYLTDPRQEPSPEKWKTDIVFLVEKKG